MFVIDIIQVKCNLYNLNSLSFLSHIFYSYFYTLISHIFKNQLIVVKYKAASHNKIMYLDRSTYYVNGGYSY